MRWVGALTGWLVFVCQPLVALSQDNAVPEAEVLRRVREALSRYDNLDLKATAHIQYPDDNGGVVVSTLDVAVKRLGPRSLISTKNVVDRPGSQPWRMQEEFLVYKNGDVLRCQAPLDADLKQVESRRKLAIGLHSKRLAGTQEYDPNTVYFALNDAGAALWIVGYAPLLDYLDGASRIEITRSGTRTEILAAGEQGRLRLTTSSSSGWLPQLFEIVKEPEHQTIGGPVASVYQNSVRSVVWTGTVEDFTSDSDGRWAPAKMSIQRRTHWKEKSPEAIDTAILLEQVGFDPPLTESDFHFSIVAPVGYPVNVRGASHLPYRWDGQAAVPGVPESPPERAQQVDRKKIEKPGASRRNLPILLMINAVLLVILVLALWRKRVSSR